MKDPRPRRSARRVAVRRTPARIGSAALVAALVAALAAPAAANVPGVDNSANLIKDTHVLVCGTEVNTLAIPIDALSPEMAGCSSSNTKVSPR